MSAPELTLREPLRLSELAAQHGMAQRGPDLEIVTMGSMNITSEHRERMLTWAAGEDFLGALDASGIAACVVHESLADSLPGRPLLVTDGDPTEAFYALFIDTARRRLWSTIESRRGEGVEIAPTAIVHDGVQLGDECVLMDHVVVLPNSRLGDRVTVKPNATIGGDGFEVKVLDGRTTMVPHCGGVWIGDDVHIGSQTCVDNGMFGSFTVVGEETRIDNLVHVGHSAQLGPLGIVAACTEIGTITAGEGFWLGPQCSVLQGANLGHHSYAGIGSVIVREIPPHALAYGSPARQHGWMCACRTKLEFEDGSARCRRCGRAYTEANGTIAEAAAATAD